LVKIKAVKKGSVVVDFEIEVWPAWPAHRRELRTRCGLTAAAGRQVPEAQSAAVDAAMTAAVSAGIPVTVNGAAVTGAVAAPTSTTNTAASRKASGYVAPAPPPAALAASSAASAAPLINLLVGYDVWCAAPGSVLATVNMPLCL
jgi:hypothetical protein